MALPLRLRPATEAARVHTPSEAQSGPGASLSALPQGKEMIYIRIALWPGGHMHNDRTLNEITITNDGTGSASVGNYDVVISRRGGFKGSGRWRILLPDPKSVWASDPSRGVPAQVPRRDSATFPGT